MFKGVVFALRLLDRSLALRNIKGSIEENYIIRQSERAIP